MRAFMAHQEQGNVDQYPHDSKCYQHLEVISRGVNAIVYKAICVPMNSTVVAIKAIDLDRSRADFEELVRREADTMSLRSHPNILKAHCTFTVDRQLWVVMPFMSNGSLQSIMSSSFPDVLPEPFITIVLKETLKALSYLHDQSRGHIHGDIKPGNILIDSNGSVKLSDFVVSASFYNSAESLSSSSSSGLFGTPPYWMPVEVIYPSSDGYDSKADIWCFGVTALELAHGRPPLSHLPPSKSVTMKIRERFRILSSDYEYEKNQNSKNNFSQSFKNMVRLCLRFRQDPSKRPSADQLLQHSLFKNSINGSDLSMQNVLQGLPSVEKRFVTTEEDRELRGECENVEETEIIGWIFNVDDFELNPVIVSPIDSDTSNAISEEQMRQAGGKVNVGDQEVGCPPLDGNQLDVIERVSSFHVIYVAIDFATCG
ncbi:hypothetical protein F0562_007506 [Nyssa sinensis]|uniref:Protein kinase domain-containing protein n=1 Tax=Nyssa sinensis TaxID=561372 RepID=A0A5J5A6X7_9ASTE|nr:hypothetical protein F0562_007506 [Nyssa sinensis]